MKYRLHIDIPLDVDQAKAIEQAKGILSAIQTSMIGKYSGDVNYRVGNDEDRNKKNYMIMDSSGHCSTQKSKFSV